MRTQFQTSFCSCQNCDWPLAKSGRTCFAPRYVLPWASFNMTWDGEALGLVDEQICPSNMANTAADAISVKAVNPSLTSLRKSSSTRVQYLSAVGIINLVNASTCHCRSSSVRALVPFSQSNVSTGQTLWIPICRYAASWRAWGMSKYTLSRVVPTLTLEQLTRVKAGTPVRRQRFSDFWSVPVFWEPNATSVIRGDVDSGG